MAKKKDNKNSEKLFASVLNLISEGNSVRSACRASNVHESTFRRAVDPAQYARARECCADVHFDGLLDLADKVERGGIDPQAARVAADIKKWNLARMKPREYGDKLPSTDAPSEQKTGIITALKGIFNAS